MQARGVATKAKAPDLKYICITNIPITYFFFFFCLLLCQFTSFMSIYNISQRILILKKDKTVYIT